MATHKLSDTIALTTEHSASSYGQPVLLIDGAAYGPTDSVAEVIPPAIFDSLCPATTAAEHAFDLYYWGVFDQVNGKPKKWQAPELVQLFCANVIGWHRPEHWILIMADILGQQALYNDDYLR